MGQGAALSAWLKTMHLLRSIGIAIAFAAPLWASNSAHACACCINTASYQLGRGVDGYPLDEIRKLTTTWQTELDAGVGESGITMAGPKASLKQEVNGKTMAWRVVLSEQNLTTGKMQKVVLRFLPEPTQKWTYIRRTEPLQTKRELSAMAHDFLIEGMVTVRNDPDKVMKNIRAIKAQLVLHAKGNQCFSSQDFYAFMLDLSLLGKDDTGGQLTGEGRIP
jgi:hypothetical protein